MSLINPTVKASWATYTDTADAANGDADDFTAINGTLSTSVLTDKNILVLKIEKVNAGETITLNDGITTASALYVVYEIK